MFNLFSLKSVISKKTPISAAVTSGHLHSALYAATSLTVILAQLHLAPAYASPVVNKHKPAKSISHPRAVPNFKRFRGEKDGSKILDDPQVRAAIVKVMGSDADKFWDRSQLMHDPISSGNFVIEETCIRGLCQFMYSLLCIDTATGKCYAGYLDDTTDHIYGAVSLDQLPAPLKKLLEDRGHTVEFDQAVWRKEKTSTAKTAPVKLNLTRLAGTYERMGGTRFTQSTLEVQELPGAKISFHIDANNGGHTGGEEGTVPIEHNHAKYTRDTGMGVGVLDFKFNQGKVTVTGDDQVFCGAAVTLLGTYKKTNDN